MIVRIYHGNPTTTRRNGGIAKRRSVKFRAGWLVDWSNECRKEKKKSRGKRAREEVKERTRNAAGEETRKNSICVAALRGQQHSGLDYRRENGARVCGRGLNCVPFLSNFFNLSRLRQLITGRNDFRLAADDEGGGDGGGFKRPRCQRRRRDSLGRPVFRIRDHRPSCDVLRDVRPGANGTFDAKSMRERMTRGGSGSDDDCCRTEERKPRSDSLITSSRTWSGGGRIRREILRVMVHRKT